jgi:RHH-type proline utilization regulon transcriptional repressor/proline dehydrogenase/delta 1-pyrroline-5-carboxylate dehydrogenase
MSQVNPSTLEASIRAVGEDILRRSEDAAPSVFSRERWQQFAMEWMTQDDDLRMRLFRLIEGLPDLRTGEELAGRLKELLQRDKNGAAPLPAPLELALSFRRNDSMFAALVARLVRWGCTQSARQFICGSTPEEAIESVLRMRRAGMAFTLDLLGETVHSDQVAEAHLQTYLRLIHDLAAAARDWPPDSILDAAPWGPIPRVNISIKLTALATGIERMERPAAGQAMLAPLRQILRAAREHGVFINVDMEHYAIKRLTLDVYKEVLSEAEFHDWEHCGIVIQAYLRDARADMEELIDWARRRGTPITVRLVKGAYWDTEVEKAQAQGAEPPVWTEKRQSDACFEDVARLMLDNADVVRIAIGSHNVRSIAAALAYAQAVGLPARTVEIQMLTGMGNPFKRALAAMKQRVRVYAPFGDLVRGMAYLIRRLIENTSNESFLRQSFGEGPSTDLLLANPAAAHRVNSP